MMLTPLKNNEFQVTTTNQFSYLPYQQHLLNCNPKQPFTRTNKLRQNLNKRGYKVHGGLRPKSVDFEVLQSLDNICRCQPMAYAGPRAIMSPPLGLMRGCDGNAVPSHAHLRASQREKSKHEGEWTHLHASTRV